MSESKKSKTTQESELCDFDFICDYVSNDDSEMITKILNNYIPSEFNVELPKLTELIIGNNELSLVMRNCLDEGDPNCMDVDPDESGLLSISTVIGLRKHNTDIAIVQLCAALNKKVAKSPIGEEIMKTIDNPANNVGLIINERIINDQRLTAQVLETLMADIKSFQSTEADLQYTHYCLLLSCSKSSGSDDVEFYHAEMKAVYEAFPASALFRIDTEAVTETIDKTTTITTHGYRAFVLFPAQQIGEFLACVGRA